MHLQVDQSGRIEFLTQDSILACADGADRVIRIPRGVKRQIFRELSAAFQAIRRPELRLFAAGVFILLKPYLKSLQHVVIDREYEGHEGEIKGMLLNHIRKVVPDCDKRNISFASIGKKARPHVIALEAFRGKQPVDHTVKISELEELLGLK